MRWPRRSMNKYRAVAVTIDGIRFASRAEARRFENLRYLERAAQISQLEAHPTFDLLAWSADGPVKVGVLTPDARYVTQDGEVVIEDVKNPATAAETSYRLRKRMFEANTGLVLTEVLK